MMKLVNTRLLGLTLLVTSVACSEQPEAEVVADAPVAPEAIALGPTVGPAPAPVTPGAEMPVAGAPGAAAGVAPGTAAPPAGGTAARPAGPTPTAATAQAAAPAPAPAPAAAPAASSDNSVYAGVYTRAQATRGNQTQQKECGACHSPGDWGGGKLLQAFNGRPLYDLTDHIRNTMPLDSPGRLSFQQYTDIIAFFLQLNNVPAGSSELPSEEAAQKAIKIEYRR